MQIRIVAAALVAFAALAALASPASAQTWPTRPVTMIVPFAAGGQVDVLGRVIAPRLSEILGQQVVVENIGGGGGMIGSAASRARRLMATCSCSARSRRTPSTRRCSSSRSTMSSPTSHRSR